MWVFVLFASILCFGDEPDVSAIQKLSDQLPSEDHHAILDEEPRNSNPRGFEVPVKIVTMEQIQKSGTERGVVEKGAGLVHIQDNVVSKVPDLLYVNFYRLEDEQGHKYLINKDGTCTYKVKSKKIESIQKELSMYQAPIKYTPAPKNIVRAEFDKKLTLRPSAIFNVGFSSGDYMQDLFNDTKAAQGYTTQYGGQFITDWKLPLKIGAVVLYEKSVYGLHGGKATYSSLSAGPSLRTKDFFLYEWPVVLQTQFRVSPLARADAQTSAGSYTYKFNSADLLSSLEHPMKNDWGKFLLGVFFQAQWLSVKDQTRAVNIKATNEINKSFGVSFVQVFE